MAIVDQQGNMLYDYVGTSIQMYDEIVYPYRRGSTLELHKGSIVGYDPGDAFTPHALKVKTVCADGREREVRITRIDNVVVL